MIQYSRQGLYIQRQKKQKHGLKKESSVDWTNVFLFILLIVVVLIFVLT